MQLFEIRTRVIRPGSNLTAEVLEAIDKKNLTVGDGDVIAFASKAVATAENRLMKASSVKPSKKARKIAAKFGMEPHFTEIVLREADEVYWGVPKALLTLKNGVLIPNAGVDQKNAPEDYVVLWPKNPHRTAESIRRNIYKKTGKRVGVLIVDSRVTPLRMGTTGIAIGLAGFTPIRDYRNEKDLYDRHILITTNALADDLASAAHILMGESNEQTPAVLIKNAPVMLAAKVETSSLAIAKEQCLFASHMKRQKWLR